MRRLRNIVSNNYGLIFVIASIIGLNLLTKPINVFNYDVFGYYLYLPKFFSEGNLLFHDLSWVNTLNESYKCSPTIYQLSLINNEHYVIRYSIGMSLIYLPFYLIGYIIALIFGYIPDGFTNPFQWSVFFGSIIITISGFVLLQKFLRIYFPNKIVQLTLICMYFGTNMLVHTSMYGTNLMTHNYLFALYAFLLNMAEKYKSSLNLRYWYYSVFICAIMALIRPVEIVSIIIPLTWHLNNPFIKLFRNPNIVLLKNVLIALIIICFTGCIQFIYWKIATGFWIINSYYNPGEGLDIFSPHLIDYLFSFRKGWILYTPLVVLMIYGLLKLKYFNDNLFFSLSFLFGVSLYITSSWTVWWYSGSYSSRAAIPMYAYLSVPLALILDKVITKKLLKLLISSFALILLISLNVFQTIQYHRGIIHPDRMTKKAYLSNFLKLKADPNTEDYLLISRSETGIDSFNNEKLYTHRIIGFEDMEEGNNINLGNSPVYEGSFSQKVEPREFSKEIWTTFNNTTTHYYAYLKISCYIFVPDSTDNKVEANLCAEMRHRGKTYYWRSLSLAELNLPKNKWVYLEFTYLTPEVRSTNDIFKTYLWNRKGSSIFIDNFKLTTFY
jgi:hypothetical protein